MHAYTGSILTDFHLTLYEINPIRKFYDFGLDGQFAVFSLIRAIQIMFIIQIVYTCS